MKCKICETRKPRRYCPGVHGDICSICCGNEREVTIECPLDCPYLREAHAREKAQQLDPATLPNADIEVGDAFLRKWQGLVMYLGIFAKKAVLANPVSDQDVREALDSLTRTYRTLASGLYYDSAPVNPYAKAIYTALREAIADYEARSKQEASALRDADILRVLVMYQRLALSYNNGRPKGRAFIGLLAEQFQQPPEPETSTPLIQI